MATNKHAQIRYQALDKCFSNMCKTSLTKNNFLFEKLLINRFKTLDLFLFFTSLAQSKIK